MPVGNKSTKFPCGACKAECKSNCVQCSDCGKWFHQECTNLPANVFAALGKIKGLFWKCDACVDNVVTAAEDQLQQLIQETKANVSFFDVMKNELLNEIKVIKQSMTTFQEKMNLKRESVHVQNTKNRPETEPTASKKPADDNKHLTQLKFIGVAESPEKYNLNQKLNDKEAVDEILADIGLNAKSSDCMRLGKFAEHKKRPILVTFNSVWDARICLSKAIENKFFETNRILIVRALSRDEQEIEKAILKKRFELVQSGIDRSQLKIRNLKLYNNGQLVTLD